MIGYIKDKDVYALFDERGTAHLHVGTSTDWKGYTSPPNCTSAIARGRRP